MTKEIPIENILEKLEGLSLEKIEAILDKREPLEFENFQIWAHTMPPEIIIALSQRRAELILNG